MLGVAGALASGLAWGGGAAILFPQSETYQLLREEQVRPVEASGLPMGSCVVLGLTDTGEGMDEATLSRAMEPFFTTKDVGKGTGLGLSMVHGLAAQPGGRLVLHSRKGVGTTAELWLPRAEIAAIPAVASSIRPQRGQPSAARCWWSTTTRSC